MRAKPSKSKNPKLTATQVVKDIRRATRKIYSAEEKIRIVLEGLRGESSIAELCRHEGINNLTTANIYFERGNSILKNKEG